MLSWTLALAATCFLAVTAPASAATILTGTGLDYGLDVGMGDGSAIGEVSDGTDTYLFELGVILDLLDPMNPIDGDLFITLLPDNDPVFLAGFLEEIEIGDDFVALMFGSLTGDGAAMFGGKARVVFTDYDPNSLTGTTSVTVSSVSPVAAIPLPASALLLLSGMGALAVARKRKAS
jgi:hypothetical protein